MLLEGQYLFRNKKKSSILRTKSNYVLNVHENTLLRIKSEYQKCNNSKITIIYPYIDIFAMLHFLAFRIEHARFLAFAFDRDSFLKRR